MSIAIVSLPKTNTPVQGILNNLNGYWQAPEFVLEQWSGACKVDVSEDMEQRIQATLESYRICLTQFYRENAL